jgi:mannan endo-1,4-beta-mannosidase
MKSVLVVCSIVIAAVSCTSKLTPRTVNDTAANPDASHDAVLLLHYIAALSEDTASQCIVGQNCCHGNQIVTAPHSGYSTFVETLYSQTGKYPGIIGIDYEHDYIFSPAQLSEANTKLIEYWNKGGLITINWAPQNPWVNDEADIAGNPGIWTNTRVNDDYSDNLKNVNIPKLLNPSEPIHAVWMKKLDRIAAALTELRDAGVVVLWRPMQEMNGFWFWWGTASDPNNTQNYKDLYRHMFNYFTYQKGLNNLLWVYSPTQSNVDYGILAVLDQYPGDGYVDIVGGTCYNDLIIQDYQYYVQTNKPIAMAEYGFDENEHYATDGTFDDRNYINTIRANYPYIAYWVTWHDWNIGGSTYNHISLKSCQHSYELMNDSDAITLDKLGWKP